MLLTFGTADALKIARSEQAHLEDNLARVLTRGVLDPAAAASELTLDAVKALVAAAYLSSKDVSTVGDWVLAENSTTFTEDYKKAFCEYLGKRSAFVFAVNAERERLAALDGKATAGGAGREGTVFHLISVFTSSCGAVSVCADVMCSNGQP